MKSFIFTVILFSVLQISSYSLDTTSAKLMPIQVGNVWTYHWYLVFGPPTSGNYKNTVTGTTVMNGHRYYIVSTTGSITQTAYIRIDSATTDYIQYSTSMGCYWLQNEIMKDSLASKLQDSAFAECSSWSKCVDTTTTQIFGQNFSYKSFTWSTFEQGTNRKYARNIGLIYSLRTALNYFNEITLKGCIINGIIYGDTSLVGIQNINNQIPNCFSLSQNYPNPFNPATKIKFDIPPLKGAGGMMTELVIYDILGREAATLVNQQLKPGTYEVEWDGTKYASGVYFYKLITSDFTETKKMVLIK